MDDDYVAWMDGPGGYREWFDANVGETSALKGPHTNSGDQGPPPPPPKKS